MSRLRREETGQTLVIAVLFLTVLLGLTAAVLDVGSWFRAQRAAQASADAAALAGAQALPGDPSGATGVAVDYATTNGDALAPADVQIADGEVANDTISVHVKRNVPGFFSKVFGIDNVDVRATASRALVQPRRGEMGRADRRQHQAPRPLGAGLPLLRPRQLDDSEPGQQRRAGRVRHAQSRPGRQHRHDRHRRPSPPGSRRASTQYLPLGGYYSDPGAKFNSSQIQAALTDRMQTELLFPVYDTLTGGGSNATYHIIAWAAFHLTDFTMHGSSGTLTGYFTSTIWDGIDATTGGTLSGLRRVLGQAGPVTKADTRKERRHMTYRIRNIAIAIALALVAALLVTFYVSNYKRRVQQGE